MKFSSVRKAVVALAALVVGSLSLLAQPVQHLTLAQPGGMPGLPVMTGISQLTNGVQLTWDGPAGYYQIFQKSNNLTTAKWLALGKATNLLRTAAITKLYSNAFFRVSGPAPKYAGSKTCLTCHLNICSFETNTPHATAFTSSEFQNAGGQNNASCLPCHTVGYGLPTGFVSAAATPQLANVQCENCHGPAANHAASPDDPTAVPRVELAAQVCGGCHSANSAGRNPPTYQEWSASGHAAVVPDVLQTMSSSTNYIRTCGVCHSGSARLALLDGLNPAVTLTKDFNVPPTCAVCHDPHQTNTYPVQLRNPVHSTNYFALTSADTATVAAFTNKYSANVNINICAQCHNDRGSAWTDSSRAPHHSVQYNFLLGSVGELQGGSSTFNPGNHAGLPSSAAYSLSGKFYLTNQCAACHMQADGSGSPDHSTMITSDAVCLNCHVTPPELLEQYYLTPSISNSVVTLLTALNRWAATKAPPALLTNNAVAWEYSTPGGLTWQADAAGIVTNWSLANPVTFTGPSTANQALIPDQIKRTRFNLYLVLNDGSFGVHNPSLAINMLNAAQIWMVQVLQ